MLFSSDWTHVTFGVTAELHFLQLRYIILPQYVRCLPTR